jgi:FtsH-binding integral membrane protein
MRLFDWNEPIDRDSYRRVAFLWLVLPLAWSLTVSLYTSGTTTMNFFVLWGPIVVATLGLVLLSMRRLLDLGVPRALALLAFVAGTGIVFYIVLSVLPSPSHAATVGH